MSRDQDAGTLVLAELVAHGRENVVGSVRPGVLESVMQLRSAVETAIEPTVERSKGEVGIILNRLELAWVRPCRGQVSTKDLSKRKPE